MSLTLIEVRTKRFWYSAAVSDTESDIVLEDLVCANTR